MSCSTDLLALALGQEAALAVAELAQEAVEIGAIEPAVRALEHRVLLDVGNEFFLAQRQIELAGVLVDRPGIDDVLEHRAIQAALARLLGGWSATEPAREVVHRNSVRALVLVGRDLVAADRGQCTLPIAGEHVGDAPHDEGQHQEQEQGFQYPTVGAAAQGI